MTREVCNWYHAAILLHGDLEEVVLIQLGNTAPVTMLTAEFHERYHAQVLRLVVQVAEDKDLATTTQGAVVQPGSVVLTLVPVGEKLFADVAIKNEDIGFIQVGQKAMVKLIAFPFQKYGLLTGKVVYVSADATEAGAGTDRGNAGGGNPSSAANTASITATYKARVALDQQHLQGPTGQRLQTGAGMQVAVEIHQGRRTVLEYLLSPVSKAVQEAGREK